MKGLRKRVSVGFLSIVVLLFFSGTISFFELRTLSGDTESILKSNQRNMKLAREMLHSVQSHDAAFAQMTIYADSTYDQICSANLDSLQRTLIVAYNESYDKHMLDTLTSVVSELKSLVGIVSLVSPSDSLHSRQDYFELYRPIHTNMINMIYDYMTSSVTSVEPRAEQLKRNAYRAVTPVLIALAVMIAIVLMLYYFMIILCVNPIVRMNRSLGDFIAFKLPFATKEDCNDEVSELQDKIEDLTIKYNKLARSSRDVTNK